MKRGFFLLILVPSMFAQLSSKDYRDFAINRDGDAARGRELFFDESRAACSKCHSTDGSAAKAGPDLQSAGDKLPRREIIQAILEPSSEIAVGYAATTVKTKTGEEFTGIIKQSTAGAIELLGADSRPIRIESKDISSQSTKSTSLMPEGLPNALTREEFNDLVQFVASLKQPASALSHHRGSPSEIPELARPVMLEPFFSEELRFPHAFVQKPGDVRFGLVGMVQPPGATNLYFVLHQTGQIWLLEKSPSHDSKTLFADFHGELFNERGPNGLLDLAFHPRFQANGKYYIKHQVIEAGKISTTLVEKIAAADRRSDSGAPSRLLLKIACTTQDHTGGCIRFGPDGFLYLGMGDTGPQQDPQGHGQDTQTLLGKILRIDVDHRDPELPYSIPLDNPFRDQPDTRPEIWALGFREPWRFSFDTLTGDLWVGDVGQDRVEEVSIVRKGENHGWNAYEGFEPFSNKYRREKVEYVSPIFAYRRKFGNSVTGGYVYRGDPKSSFYGVYICGDYTSHRIWGITHQNRVLNQVFQIATAPMNIASFATDNAGLIYVIGYEGMIYKLDLATASFPK